MKKYKTIIIGAGPAGLIAGKTLKDDFLILEKKKEIGKPVQCIGMSVSSFKRQDINENLDYVKAKIHKIERIMPNGKKIGRYKKDHIGYVVERNSFEKYLSKNIMFYIKTGVEVVDIQKNNENLWNIVTTDGNIYTSEYVIGADGINSFVRKKIFSELENKISLAFGLEYSVIFANKIDTGCIKFYLNNEIYHKGYGWFFPTSKNTANIGVGSENERLNFNELLKKIIEENSEKYGNYSIINKTKGITGSMVSFSPLFQDNVFLVGDAAGLNDPIFRAGTNQAMISGRIASQCILEKNPNKYSDKIKSLPFVSPRVKKSSNIFYGFSNELLEEMGSELENKGFSDLKIAPLFLKIIKKKQFRKNILKILYFFKSWELSKKWLW